MRVKVMLVPTIAAVAALAVVAGPVSALAPVGPNVIALWQGEGDATDPFNAHNGMLVGGVTFAAASSGQAFSFGGAGQDVDVPDAADLYSAASFTVAAWVRTSLGTGTQSLVTHYECGNFCPSGAANATYSVSVTDGKADGFVRDNDGGGPVNPPDTGGQYLTGGPSIADGTAHHVALVRDTGAGELRLLVDGTPVASAVLNPGATGALANLDGEADDLYLGAFRRCGAGAPGCDGALVQPLTGLLDDAVYWDRALGTAQLAAIHTAGPNGLTTDVAPPDSSATAPATATVGATISVGFTASDPQGPASRVHDPSNLAGVDLYVKAPGAAAFTKAATAAAAVSGVFAYTLSAATGTYGFATVATDLAGNAEAVPTTADAVTTIPSAPVPAGTPPKLVTPKTVEQVVLGLPSTRSCLSRRAFSIHLRLPQGSTVRSATVSVDGHRVAVRSGAKLTAPVNLKGLPRGKYTVKIVLRLAAGKTITGTRRYRTCAPTHR